MMMLYYGEVKEMHDDLLYYGEFKGLQMRYYSEVKGIHALLW